MNQSISSDCEWRDIPGYEGLYQVSNDGQVRSLYFWNGHEYKKRSTPRMMTQRDNKGGKGYMLVTLNKPYGEKKDYRVHRLVAMAFIPNPENKQEINHLDGNTKNNLVENLEWCTHTENIQHAIETGLIKTFKGDIDEIIRLNQCEGYTGIQIADLMHTKETTLRGFIRKHGVGLKRVSRYGIDLNVLKEQFALGMTNKELAMKYHCSSNLIARRRYQMKRGMI